MYFTPKGTLVPECPVATVMLTGLVMAVAELTGLETSQEKLMLQLLCPSDMAQEGVDGVRVPDISGGGVGYGVP
ncbi:MAG: hypothetical protein WD963_00760 [Candidatus Paceibacterota bacterium]